jgi:hypothetical protein
LCALCETVCDSVPSVCSVRAKKCIDWLYHAEARSRGERAFFV